MTVKELIKILKTMPPNLEVATRAHDNSELEMQGFIHRVELVDFDKTRKDMLENNRYMGEDMKITGKFVMLDH